MKLANDDIELIENALDGEGEVRSYSGRAMYGKCCLGIVSDNTPRSLMVLIKNLMEDGQTSLVERLSHTTVREDSMGKGTVVYFPSLEMDEDEDEDE